MNSTSQLLVKMRRERLAQLRKEIEMEEGRVTALRASLAESERALRNMREDYASTWVDIQDGWQA